MRRYVIPFISGFALASALFWFVFLPQELHDTSERGFTRGRISTQVEIERLLPEAVGADLDRAECTNLFLPLHNATIWVVERHGVKTLRAK